ncbi:unnamed protein product [Heterobilharzia americana]|nr:unnamed protein product [Heterobilharzia americana]
MSCYKLSNHLTYILSIFELLFCLGISSFEFSVPNYKTVYIDDFINQPKWMSTHKSFTFPKKSRIAQIAVQPSSNSVFIAVNNSLVRISVDTFLKKDEATWFLSSQELTNCPRPDSDSKTSCNQYTVTLVKVVEKIFPGPTNSILHQSGVYVCLSNGMTAECSFRQANQLRAPSKIHWKSVHHCPIDPDQPVTGLITSTQNLYMGTKTGPLQNSEVHILKVKSVENLNSMKLFKYPIRTPPDDRMIKQNNSTVFIHSFEFHNAVYFLFRELADETVESCDKSIIVSRIGRLCNLDAGNQMGNFNNFLKATIICPSTPEDNSNSLIFTELQAVYVDQSTKTLFGTFQTSLSMPTASAICEYSLVEIESVFNGEFYKTNAVATTIRNDYKCEKYTSNSFSKTDYHLMFKTVRPRYDRPILVQQGEIYTQIAVSKTPGTLRSDMNMVIFVTNTKGMLYKWHVKEFQVCLVELIYLVPRYSTEPITKTVQMELVQKTSTDSYLLVAMEDRVLRLPIARCSRFGHERMACRLLRDPFCGWNDAVQKCEDINNNDRIDSNIITFDSDVCEQSESLEKYPVEKFPIQNSNNQIKPTGCKCRFRTCNSPFSSKFDDNACLNGSSVQIASCSYDGGWTEWSAWSGCEPVCYSQHHETNVTPTRTRYRWCSNPMPVGEGHECVGPDKETELCTNEIHMCSADPLPTFEWTAWSAWSECTLSCNGGRQFRRRLCKHENDLRNENFEKFTLDHMKMLSTDQSMYTDKILCIGKAFEARECNTHSCSVTKTTSPWSEWYITDENVGKESVQRRYRVECSAKLPKVDSLQTKTDIQTRICKVDRNNYAVTCEGLVFSKLKLISFGFSCLKIHNESIYRQVFDYHEQNQLVWPESINKEWSSWSECSQPCGGGRRYRKRIRPSLHGMGDNTISSNKLISSAKLTQNEYETQDELCNFHSCTGYWSCWSEWSKCSQPEECSQPRGTQRRYRKCIYSLSSPVVETSQLHNTSMCYGGFENSVQTMPCEVQINETKCLQKRLDEIRIKKRSVETESTDTKEPLPMSSSEWAVWSECITVEHLSYSIRMRIRRKSCENCEWIQFERCDTRQSIAPQKVLGDKYKSYQEVNPSEDSNEQYDMLHAVISTSLSSSIWRKITNERLTNNTQSNLLPYEWFLDTTTTNNNNLTSTNNMSNLKGVEQSVGNKSNKRKKTKKMMKDRMSIQEENIDNPSELLLLTESERKNDEKDEVTCLTELNYNDQINNTNREDQATVCASIHNAASIWHSATTMMNSCTTQEIKKADELKNSYRDQVASDYDGVNRVIMLT